MNRLISILFAVGLLATVSCSSRKREAPQKKSSTNDSLSHDRYSAPLHPSAKKAQAVDFTTSLLRGGTFQLSNQKGKVVLLNIWATWCPPCEEETPALQEMYEKYQSRGVVFLGISIDEQGKSVVKPFIKKHNLTYPITIDDSTIMQKYGPLMGIPTTYLIDRRGNLRYFATGAITQKELVPRLEHLLDR